MDNQEYRLQVRVKNNLILKRINLMGFDSVSKFCEKYNICDSQLGQLINFVQSPYDRKGEYKKIALDLMKIFNCTLSELFTETQLQLKRKKSKIEIEISEKQLQIISNDNTNQNPLLIYEKEQEIEKLHNAIKYLTEREQKFLISRFFDNLTYEEMAKKYSLTRERCRQIELRAIRKLRHPARGLINNMEN